jgi:hypothetical protein
MEAHTALAKCSLSLDLILGEKMVELDGGERDLSLRGAMLVDAQSRGLTPPPWDKCEELMEFIELRRLLQDAEVDRVIEAGWLAILARDVSKVLVDLGMPPIPGIPRDPRMTDNVLEAMDVILERMWEAYASGHNP